MQSSSCVLLENLSYLCSSVMGNKTENHCDLHAAILQLKREVNLFFPKKAYNHHQTRS